MKRQSHSYSNLQGTLPTNTNVKFRLYSSDFSEYDDRNCDDHNHTDNQLVQYPDNLNVKDIFYFIAAPTLCYELNFPCTDRIRKRFLLKRILEVVLGLQLIMALMQQYMIPSVRNSLIPFSNMDVTKATERLLKLAVSFYLVFGFHDMTKIHGFRYPIIWCGCYPFI